MEAPKCRTCGERHWGLCQTFTRKVVKPTAMKPLPVAFTPQPEIVGTNTLKPKRGRPLAKDVGKTVTATKPWMAAGMSRTTWYRRQAETAKLEATAARLERTGQSRMKRASAKKRG